MSLREWSPKRNSPQRSADSESSMSDSSKISNDLRMSEYDSNRSSRTSENGKSHTRKKMENSISNSSPNESGHSSSEYDSDSSSQLSSCTCTSSSFNLAIRPLWCQKEGFFISNNKYLYVNIHKNVRDHRRLQGSEYTYSLTRHKRSTSPRIQHNQRFITTLYHVTEREPISSTS